MKKLFSLTIFIGLAVFTIAQKKQEITIGHIERLYSKILDEQRPIFVYTPPYKEGEKYPVIYLLDGGSNFNHTVGMCQRLSQNAVLPEMIIIGILNTNRNRDLTPTKGILSEKVDSVRLANSGGGENFISFIEKELIPYVDSTYPTQTYRTFVGHSLGGLTVLHTLMYHTDLFKSYIAIDPSMWWDNERLLEKYQSTLFNDDFKGTSLYLGIANNAGKEMKLNEISSDTSQSTVFMRSLVSLHNYLKSENNSELKYEGKYYENDNHTSLPHVTTYDGLRFIFNFYRLIYSSADWKNDSKELANKIRDHYKKVSKQLGFDEYPDEKFISAVIHHALKEEFFVRAKSFIQLYMDAYPNSSIALDLYGDYFRALNDTSNAVLYYEKAISLKQNLFTEQKLKTIRGAEPILISEKEFGRYVGSFYFRGDVIRTEVRENSLWALIDGKASVELVSITPNQFIVLDSMDYILRFELKRNKVLGVYKETREGTIKGMVVK